MNKASVYLKVKPRWWFRIVGGALVTLGKLLPYRWQWKTLYWLNTHGLKVVK